MNFNQERVDSAILSTLLYSQLLFYIFLTLDM